MKESIVEIIGSTRGILQCYTIQSQSSKILGHGNLVARPISGPLGNKLASNIPHFCLVTLVGFHILYNPHALNASPTVEHVTNSKWAKGGHENSMGQSPILFKGKGGEQSIVDTISDLEQSPGRLLGEPFLVTHLIEELIGADGNRGVTRQAQLVCRS